MAPSRRLPVELRPRVGELLATERARYTDLLDSLAIDPGSPERLREAYRRVDDLRFAAREQSPDAGPDVPAT